MKLLVVPLLAALAWSRTEGRNVSVCELTAQLRSAAANQTVLSGSGLDYVLAKIVCNVNMVSKLSTSAETNVSVVVGKGLDDSGETGEGGRHKRRRHAGGSGESHEGAGSSASPRPPAQNCTLYGIFQLSGCQACNNSVTPTANTCGLSCSELLDDDIGNDIACLLKVISSEDKKSNVWQELKESPGEYWKNQKSQCSDVSAYKC